MNRHNFNRKRNARRLAAMIERQMQELSGSRQSWDEWRYLEQMQANLFKQERG